ncbi:MAG: hypothetical protein WCC87_03420 [Candidatus Korobacteraceae bacterium]
MKKHSSTTLTLAIFFAMVATMTLSAVAQEEIVGGPSSMYYNPNQVALKAWYLANEVIDFSTVYDSAGGAHALSQPSAMAFDGSNLWISNAGNNTVVKIRASDGQFQASYAVTSPGSLAFDGQRIWVDQRTSTGGNTVTVLFAADGKQALTPVTVGTMPNMLAWDGWGMWVVARDSTFKRIDNWGNTYCSGTTPGGTGWDYGVAFDGNNTWITDYANSKVYEYNWQCQLQQTVSVSGGPVGITFDGTNMWTANENNGTVAQITPSGVVHYYTVGGYPWDVAFDGANIWVTTGAGGTVKKITAFGNNLGTVSGSITPCVNTSGPTPLALAFDGASMWASCPSSNAIGKM